MALPPTPASLVDLPGPWLLKLAGSDRFKGQDATLWALSRSCSLFRDLVLRQRKAAIEFKVPIAAKDFPRELRRLCTLARGSGNITLVLSGPDDPSYWTETEPHAAHLLLCAMAQLGGQPLTAVKEIRFEHLEQTSVVPMWLPLVCPNVTNLECMYSAITDHLPLPAPPPPRSTTSASPAPAPVACRHLQHLDLSGTERLEARHLRQQLAALPSLTSLSVGGIEGLAAELHSTSVTRLRFNCEQRDVPPASLQLLPVQFPNLVELDAPWWELEDGGLEALLSMHSLRRVDVLRAALARDHSYRRCTWEQLSLGLWDVDSLGRLPLEGIQRVCLDGSGRESIRPSRDAQAVARAAAAIKRLGLLRGGDVLRICGEDPAALLTTLRPLLEALPAEKETRVAIWGTNELATAGMVRQLGRQLTPSVRTLAFAYTCTLAPKALAALLPSLPATVARVEVFADLGPPESREAAALAMCRAAVRPVEVRVGMRRGTAEEREQAVERVRAQLAAEGDTFVTLVA